MQNLFKSPQRFVPHLVQRDLKHSLARYGARPRRAERRSFGDGQPRRTRTTQLYDRQHGRTYPIRPTCAALAIDGVASVLARHCIVRARNRSGSRTSGISILIPPTPVTVT